MYHLTVTLTEDLFGATISADAWLQEGRRTTTIDGVTWFCEFSSGISDAQHAEVRKILDKAVTELSQNLRRVFPGVSSSEEAG